MLFMAVHQVPSLTRERYEEVVRRLTNGKSRIESPSDLPFEGLLVHVAGQGKNGFCIVDVFASEEAVAAFRDAVGTIPQEVGIEEPPDFFPAHTFSRCEQDTSSRRSLSWSFQRGFGLGAGSIRTLRSLPEPNKGQRTIRFLLGHELCGATRYGLATS